MRKRPAPQDPPGQGPRPFPDLPVSRRGGWASGFTTSPERLPRVPAQGSARGRPADLVEIVLPGRSWAEIAPDSPVFPAAARASRQKVWTLPLSVQDTPLGHIADGATDAQWIAFADSVARAGGPAVVRLRTPAEADPEQVKAAFRRVALIIRARSGAYIEWTAPVGSPPARANETWPGADVVDIVGLDVPRSGTWTSIVAPAGGLIDWTDWARANQRPVSIHWTLDKQANPPWIRNMAGWVAFKAAQRVKPTDRRPIAYETVAEAAGADPAGVITYRALW